MQDPITNKTLSKMKRFFLIFLIFQLSSCDVLKDFVGEGGLTNAQIGEGLKQALYQGAEKAVLEFSKDPSFLTEGSGIKIPAEALEVISALNNIPVVRDYTRQFTDKVTVATTRAVEASLPIFKSAITELTFADAYNILMAGEKDAATRYLEGKTYNPLYNEFNAITKDNLQEVGALQEWEKIADLYNKLPFKEKVNPDFNGFISDLALQSIFKRIEREEEGIRDNVALRTTDLMKRVFARQDKKGEREGGGLLN